MNEEIVKKALEMCSSDESMEDETKEDWEQWIRKAVVDYSLAPRDVKAILTVFGELASDGIAVSSLLEQCVGYKTLEKRRIVISISRRLQYIQPEDNPTIAELLQKIPSDIFHLHVQLVGVRFDLSRDSLHLSICHIMLPEVENNLESLVVPIEEAKEEYPFLFR